MSPMQRAAAALVFAVVLVAVGVLLIRGLDPVATASPTPGTSEVPSVSPDATASAGEPEPSGEDAQAILGEIEAAVERLRGLPPAGIGPAEVITRDQLVDELAQSFEEEYPAEERRADDITLRAMGLLTPDQSLADLQLDLLGEQVLGFYDDMEQRMVVVSDAGVNAEARFTYAHEYTHALQDAEFGLDTLETDAQGEDDRNLARISLIEGDATLSMFVWALNGGLTQQELTELFESPVLDMSGIPDWLVAITEFPYTFGFEWTVAIAGENPLAPDFGAIDDAFARPPSSTEQILHVDKWESGEEPIGVEPVALAQALGSGWEDVEATTVGEAWIGINLEYYGVDLAIAGNASVGWGGDRLVVASGPEDAFALAWLTAWDTSADATEFATAYETAIAALDFPADVMTLADGRVLVAHASTDALLAQTIAAAGG